MTMAATLGGAPKVRPMFFEHLTFRCGAGVWGCNVAGLVWGRCQMLPGTSGVESGMDCAWHDMGGMGWWCDVEE
jgi:hypothetical protein